MSFFTTLLLSFGLIASSCGGNSSGPVEATASAEPVESAAQPTVPPQLALPLPDAQPQDVERDDALISALAQDLLGDDTGFTDDPAEATCVAEATYDGIGSERLAELGVTIENPDPGASPLSVNDAASITDALFDCIDMAESFASSIEGDGVSKAQADCMSAEFGEDGLWNFVNEALRSGPESGPTPAFLEVFAAASETCGVSTE